jgi:hypothetical protein
LIPNRFLWPMPFFSFQHTNNAYEVILYLTALLCFPKNLSLWRDSNPGLLVPEADSLSTAPRLQGTRLLCSRGRCDDQCGESNLRSYNFADNFSSDFCLATNGACCQQREHSIQDDQDPMLGF